MALHAPTVEACARWHESEADRIAGSLASGTLSHRIAWHRADAAALRALISSAEAAQLRMQNAAADLAAKLAVAERRAKKANQRADDTFAALNASKLSQRLNRAEAALAAAGEQRATWEAAAQAVTTSLMGDLRRAEAALVAAQEERDGWRAIAEEARDRIKAPVALGEETAALVRAALPIPAAKPEGE